MIELPRGSVRRFLAVYRKCAVVGEPRQPDAEILCRAIRTGLSLSADLCEVGLRHLHPGRFAAAEVVLPAALLTDLAAGEGTAALRLAGAGKWRADWDEAGVPHRREFDAGDPRPLAAVPEPAKAMADLPASFLGALGEAVRTTRRDAGRLALGHVLLRGAGGLVVGTDGRQLLMHGGFALPWRDDVLVASVPAFAARELAGAGPVRIGRVADRVLVEAGPWLISVRAAGTVRYPDVMAVIPQATRDATHLHLGGEDAKLLLRAVSGRADKDAPVALDLAGAATLQVGEGEVALSQSRVDGPTVRLLTDRTYLARAVRLGFRTLVVGKAGRPVVCRDGDKTYVWMPHETTQIPPAGAALPSATPGLQPQTRTSMPHRNGQSADPPHDNGTGEPADLLAEAELIRTSLQDALARTGRLIAALKHHRRQSKALRAAMTSLQRLHPPGS